jgi:hypothetical protein
VVRVEMQGKIAQHLTGLDGLSEAERYALRQGPTVRRSQGYSLHATAVPQVHRALLAAAVTLTSRIHGLCDG